MAKMTFHLDDRQTRLLRTIALVEQIPVVALVRTGVDLAIDQHLSDPAFKELLHNALAEERLFASAAEAEQIQEDLPEETGE